MTETLTGTRISLEMGCDFEQCVKFVFPLYKQMSEERFSRMAALPLLDVDEWAAEHRTARKRANRCERLGYTFRVVRREEHSDECLEIGISKKERQGRPMSKSYTEFYDYGPLPKYPCERHQVRTYGVFSPEGRMVAYLWLYVAGQLRLCSSIIGHGDHLDNGIMFLLFRGMLEVEMERDPDGVVMYHTWDNGQWGLRQWKGWVGLSETAIEWRP